MAFQAGQPLDVQDLNNLKIEGQNESITASAAVNLINFLGEGVDATPDGQGGLDITIPGGGGGSSVPRSHKVGRAIDVTNGDADFSDLQLAVNAALPGEQVNILPLSFPLNATIGKRIILVGNGSRIGNGAVGSLVFLEPVIGAFATILDNINATDVEITADNEGLIGDNIIITGDGSSDVDTLLGVWNSANPLNQAQSLQGGDQVPDDAYELQLSGGADSVEGASGSRVSHCHFGGDVILEAGTQSILIDATCTIALAQSVTDNSAFNSINTISINQG